MEPTKESHAEYLLRTQIEACEVHRANYCSDNSRFDAASDSFFELLGDMFRARKLEG
jgi:hypothetical protein